MAIFNSIVVQSIEDKTDAFEHYDGGGKTRHQCEILYVAEWFAILGDVVLGNSIPHSPKSKQIYEKLKK